MVTIISEKTAPARLTKDSMPSESKPTEPVTCQASSLSTIVATAVSEDIFNRVLGLGNCMAHNK